MGDGCGKVKKIIIIENVYAGMCYVRAKCIYLQIKHGMMAI